MQDSAAPRPLLGCLDLRLDRQCRILQHPDLYLVVSILDLVDWNSDQDQRSHKSSLFIDLSRAAGEGQNIKQINERKN
ncbi:hypothetical protein RRG08_008724 [Elysia crispata]|uniref:Uncharacterized protein n=1 Tax=Elysia crispata TaxID=231223 RepID=A0AAE1CKI9_9GAST|nr:hypothetical protein RRG08_008724 [Elysia crispata]